MSARLRAAVERVLDEAELIDDPDGYYGMLIGVPALDGLREALAPTPEEITNELQPVPEGMFRWSVRVMCDAELAEEWLIDIPANTHEDEVEAALGGELAEGNAHFIREQAQNERNREIYDYDRSED